MLPLVPKSTVPAFTWKMPVNVLLAVSERLPLPLFRKFPAPLIAPELVIVLVP